MTTEEYAASLAALRASYQTQADMIEEVRKHEPQAGFWHDHWWAEKQRADGLAAAVAEHHRQKADDRCVEDDDRLYAAAGLPPCDRRVGDKAAMLKNCERFIERRCQGGGWPSYAELEAERDRLRKDAADAAALRRAFAKASEEYGRAYEGHMEMLPEGYEPTEEEKACMEAWRLFYIAIRDHSAGMALLAETQRLRDQVQDLTRQLAACRSVLSRIPEEEDEPC